MEKLKVLNLINYLHECRIYIVLTSSVYLFLRIDYLPTENTGIGELYYIRRRSIIDRTAFTKEGIF